MKRLLADSELEKVSAHIAEQMGLNFPPSKWQNLEQSLCTAARELNFQDLPELVARFTSTPPSRELIESLACYLTIGETYFLREIRCLEIFEQQVIPEIIRKRQGNEQRLRIWSAGCATGEEPYSIAILLHRMRDILRDWEISILATDINPNALAKAREGIYTDWSFRNTPKGFREHYFRGTGKGRFELLPGIKKMVKFSCLNLVEDCYPSLVTDTNAIDVIFCRNVLMYFTPQLAGKVVERLHRSLLNGGWLFVSPCETSIPCFSGFESITSPDATVYRKQGIGETARVKYVSPAPPLPDYPVQITPPIQNVSPIQKTTPVQEPAQTQEADPCQKAQMLYECGAYREAAGVVAEILRQDNNDTRALALLCRIYANEGKLTEALQISDQALAANKLSAGLHYLRAIILMEQGMNDESAASLKKSLYLDQDMILAYFTLANLEKRTGKENESRRHFDTALSLLARYRQDDVIPDSEGILAGRLSEIIRATTARCD